MQMSAGPRGTSGHRRGGYSRVEHPNRGFQAECELVVADAGGAEIATSLAWEPDLVLLRDGDQAAGVLALDELAHDRVDRSMRHAVNADEDDGVVRIEVHGGRARERGIDRQDGLFRAERLDGPRRGAGQPPYGTDRVG